MGFEAFILVLIKISLVFGLVLLNGFFVAAEFSIVKVRETQLDTLIAKGHAGAKVAKKVVQQLDAALSATQLGITLASLALGWFAEPIFASLLEPALERVGVHSEQLQHSIAFAVGFSVITFLHIVVGELAPKSVAIQKPVPTTLLISRPLLWFFKLSYPFIWALNRTSNLMLRQIGIEVVGESELHHSDEELRLLLMSQAKGGNSQGIGRDIILNAFDLKKRVVREVMRPWREIEYFDTSDPIEKCVSMAEKTRFSRFPLAVDGDLDKTIGVVHFKDLFAFRHRVKRGKELMSVARPIIYVPETARLETLLQMFLDRKLHLAMVVDEYGGTLGMVTLENILEELVGPIQDEFDHELPLKREIQPGEWEVEGTLPLHELSELVEEPLFEEGISTTSGWVTFQLGDRPKEGSQIPLSRWTVEVLASDPERLVVTRLRVKRNQPLDLEGSGGV